MTWCPFNSRLNSSTRTELGAAILTLLAPVAVHIGIDNAAVVQTGRQIIDHLRRRAKEVWVDSRGIGILGGKASPLHKLSPFKARWAMMKNGDLWEVFTNIVLRRGPETAAISKVKGHATDEMVAEGQVRLSDKKGNDRADKAAEKGAATGSQYKIHRHGGMYSRRHKEYRTLMCRIQNFLVGLKEEERRLKQEAAKQKGP